MNAHRAGLAVVAIVLLAWLPSHAQAHPALVGAWTAPLPPGMVTTYEFGPGEFVTHQVWKGPMRVLVNNCEVATGVWELRMFTGTEGTVSMRDGLQIGTSVGTVDFATRTFTYMNVFYRR